ncbi:amino acid adenylation domain-containing protein [Nocardia sp. CC227C]|uniref:amino acid adenylation domain-containing protein n=1 Tax=Nocardia sp. CC227C TaxID=3044562 RepID=UPI00278C24A7|nr:amino acid adenylation domain-containing protein [Nocardia sp. CC227C]
MNSPSDTRPATVPAEADPAELIARLRRLGIELWTEEGALRYRAPAGVFTDELKQTLKRHRDDVIALLSAQRTLTPAPEQRFEPFPLTDVQSAYLLGQTDAFDYGGVSCHGYLEVWLGEVDPDAVQTAWADLVRRHDMLRAVVDPATGTQRILPDVPPVRVRRDDSAERVRAELSHARYDAARWPLHSLCLTPGWLLHLSVDLLIADFASVQLLVGELLALLRGETLPPIDISFRDYVLAQRALRDGPDYAEHRDYWQDRLDELPPGPDLPLAAAGAAPGESGAARPSSTARSAAATPGPATTETATDTPTDNDSGSTSAVRFHRLQRRIPTVRDSAAAHGVTTSALVLAAYAEAIGRWSRTPRFTVNMPLQNRLALHEQVCALVGDFTSVNLLEVDLTEPVPLVERARRLGARLLSDIDHRLYSGVEVLRELGRRAANDATDSGRTLMPVVFTGVLGGGTEVRYGISQTPQVWIDCQAVEQDDTMLVSWDVREGVFPEGLAEAAFDMFVTLLTGPADIGPPHPLPTDQQRIRKAVNDTHTELPTGLLHEPWLAAAHRHGDRPALIAGGRVLSHAELLARAQRVAAALRAEVRPGDLVAVTMDKGLDQIAAVLGVLLAGAAYVPVDTNQPAPRRAAMLDGIDHVLTEIPDTGADVPELPPPGIDPDALAYVIYTSGSTGTPKGVMISHAAARNTIEDINSRFEITEHDRVLGLAQLGFDLSVYDIFGVLGAGGCLILPDPDRRGDPSHWAELIIGHGVTIWNSVPAQAQMLADYLPGDAPSVRVALLSGDWIPVTLPAQLRERLPKARLISLGGATEASIWSISHEIEDLAPGATSVPYGKPLANQRFRIVDALGQDCPDWVPGELWIGGVGVARGYRGDDALTDRKFGDGWYRTGDLGRYLPDGNIEFLGRADNQVKVRGHRIELAEIEAALAAHPEVAAAAVVVQGEGTARRLVAFTESALHQAGAEVLRKPTAGAASGEVEAERVAEFAHALDAAVLADARAAVDAVAEHEVAPRHRDLLRRWRNVLRDNPAPEPPDTDARAAESPAAATDGAEPMAGTTRGVEPQPAGVSAVGSAPGGDVSAVGSAPGGGAGAGGSEPARARAGGSAPVAARAADTAGVAAAAGRTAAATAAAAEGRTAATAATADPGASDAWGRVRELAVPDLCDERLIDYLHTCAQSMPAVLRGELDPMALMFPNGGMAVAEAAYRTNIMTRYLNAVVAEAVRRRAPRRVLEVGAGVGATTAEVLAAGYVPTRDYVYTDVSPYLLDHGRSRFPGLTFARYDIDVPPREQGFAPESFDLILCAGVLNNARHTGRTLGWLRELLAPGGTLVVTEPTREHYEVLASQSFMMTAPEDQRADTGHTFLTREEWLAELEPFGEVTCLPEPGHPLEPLGQHVFVAGPSIEDQLRATLPDYMVPAVIETLPALPLTDNGKVDRRALAALADSLATASDRASGADDEPRDDLERQLAGIIADVVRRRHIPRTANLFGLGADSVMLSQIAGRVQQEVALAHPLYFDSILRQLLHQPALADLADHLRAAGDPESAAPTTPLVDLGGPPSDPNPVIVLVHEGLGTMAPYQRLAARLSATRRVIGLAVPDARAFAAIAPEVLVDRLAADYADALLAAGHTTIRLVGYCLGGLLATEVARTFTERGGRVDRLTVISSYPPEFEVGEPMVLEGTFAQALGADPATLGYPGDTEELGRALADILAATPGRIPAGSLDFGALAELSPEERIARITTDPDQFAVFRNSFQAASRYAPPLYAGDITLLRPREGMRLVSGMSGDLADYWSKVCLGRLDVVEIPGNHFTCLAHDLTARL